MNEAKPFEIDKRLVYESFKAVKSNKGSAGIDNIEMDAYENNMSRNLYKLWNRMSSNLVLSAVLSFRSGVLLRSPSTHFLQIRFFI